MFDSRFDQIEFCFFTKFYKINLVKNAKRSQIEETTDSLYNEIPLNDLKYYETLIQNSDIDTLKGIKLNTKYSK